MFNNMNIALKKNWVATIKNQWLKGEKYLVVGYANKTSKYLMGWLYICYGKIMPGKLMNNQDMMQASYHVGEMIEILFNQI